MTQLQPKNRGVPKRPPVEGRANSIGLTLTAEQVRKLDRLAGAGTRSDALRKLLEDAP